MIKTIILVLLLCQQAGFLTAVGDGFWAQGIKALYIFQAIYKKNFQAVWADIFSAHCLLMKPWSEGKYGKIRPGVLYHESFSR